MASLHALRKRLRSIRSTEQLASAMRTAATAKYARVNKVRAEYAPYADACRDMLSLLGDAGIARHTEAVPNRRAYILLSSNRGLCGGFHAELFRFFADILAKEDSAPLLLSGGRKAASHLKEKYGDAEVFPVSDIPTFEEARALSERVRSLYESGEVSEVHIVYQRFRNMLIQTPAVQRLLPGSGEKGAEDENLLYLPDRAAISERLAISCLDAQIYSLLLENASGAQAATLMAMRSACDNAAETAAKLEISINRQRQAQVTASVIETASGNLHQGE